MAKLIVTNTNSSGAGSLADAVSQANATAAADTIVFAKTLAGQSIDLSGDLILTNKVTISGDINGDGDGDITLNFASGHIVNHAGNRATLTSLVITAGYVDVQRAHASAIDNKGTMAIKYSYITQNTTYGGSYGYGATASSVLNNGTLSITQSSISGNSNHGAHGYNTCYYGVGGNGGNAAAVINHGSISLDSAAFTNNFAQGGDGGYGGSPYNGRHGYRGGNGGNAAGGIINHGSVSGTYMASGNNVSGGLGGAGGVGSHSNGADGHTGSATPGILNGNAGSNTATTLNLGTMGVDLVNMGKQAQFAGLGGADHISAGAGSNIDGGAGNDTIRVTGNYYGTPLSNTVRGGMGSDTIISEHTVAAGFYDGGKGHDTINFSNDFLNGQTIDLSLASFLVFGATFTSFENVIGSNSGDIILGNDLSNTLDGRNGDDTIEGGRGMDHLDGGAGNDTLDGGRGYDQLTGNLGADKFQFDKVSDSPTTATLPDMIEDFTRREGDKIDLSRIDSNSVISGNQAFKFVGSGPFTDNSTDPAHRGELRYVVDAGGVTLLGDVNGDDVADFAVSVFGKTAMKLTDFIL